jgi:hypothetical protein
MRIRVSSAAPGTNEAILNIDGFKFRVDMSATAALYAEPRLATAHAQCPLDQAKRIFPPAIAEQLGALGLHLDHLAKDFGWPACAWFPSSFRTYQNHLFAFHLVGRPTDTTHQRAGEWRWALENPYCDRPIELRIARSQHPDRRHLLTLWVSVPGVPFA